MMMKRQICLTNLSSQRRTNKGSILKRNGLGAMLLMPLGAFRRNHAKIFTEISSLKIKLRQFVRNCGRNSTASEGGKKGKSYLL